METHIEGALYGNSYRGYNVYGHIYMVQSMATYLEGTKTGDTYRGYNVLRFI